MDSAQFKKWLANHCKRYNAVEGWLRAKPVDGADNVAGQKDIMEAWFSVLADCRIDDAIWATEAMFRGDVAQPQGPGFDDHPRTVRRYAMERAAERAKQSRKGAGGERVYECVACLDRGWRDVWIPEFLAWAREAFADGPPHDAQGNQLLWAHWRMDARAASRPKHVPEHACVACTCPAGQNHINRGAVRFDATKHFDYEPREGLAKALESAPVAQKEF